MPPVEFWMTELHREYGLTMTMHAVAAVLKMSKRSVLSAISQDRFPIATFRVGAHRLAKTQDVANYLAHCEHDC